MVDLEIDRTVGVGEECGAEEKGEYGDWFHRLGPVVILTRVLQTPIFK